ncbi:MAG TPA: glutathione synthase [Gammaproteobacteria bacterium]|nr:glutathione synthase [Gammaproteobacteria bacterium]
MKLGLAVNDIDTEKVAYTTTWLAMTAAALGHEVWYINVADFVYGPDESVYAHARSAPSRRYRSAASYLQALRSGAARAERILVDELDVLLLRNDPAEDVIARPWARLAGINFGRLAVRKGVIVLNDPDGLSRAVNKMYLQYFPEYIRPRTLISRNREEIKDFIRKEGGTAVLKPLTGSGGHNVFLVDPAEKANLNQMIDAVRSEGYVIAQEYLPRVVAGDTRLFLMNGRPLRCQGRYAAIRRVREAGDGDIRSNITAGGVARKAEVDENMLKLAHAVRPKLVQDGLFLVGMDIVGDRLMEINVFSPGGLDEAGRLEGVNFFREVIGALEHKVDSLHRYHRNFSNVELASL